MDKKSNFTVLLTNNISWTFFSDLTIATISFFGQIWFARILGVEIIGQYALLVLSVEVSKLPIDFGFNLPVIRFHGNTKIFQAAFTLTIIQIVIISLIWLSIACFFFHFHQTERASLFIPGIILLISRIIGQLAILIYAPIETDLNYRFLSISRLLSTTIGMVISVLLVLFNFGLLSLATRELLISTTLIVVVWIKSKPTMVPIFSIKEISKVIKFSTGIWLLNILERTSKRIDYFIIGIFLGRNALGIYFQIRGIIESILGFLVKPVQTVLYSSICQHPNIKFFFKAKIKNFLIAFTFLTIFSSISLNFLGESIVDLLLGKEWISGSFLLPGFTFYLCAIFLFENIKVVMISNGYHHLPIIGRIFQILFLVILTAPLTKYFGLIGSGYASGISAIALLSSTFYLCFHNSFKRKLSIFNSFN